MGGQRRSVSHTQERRSVNICAPNKMLQVNGNNRCLSGGGAPKRSTQHCLRIKLARRVRKPIRDELGRRPGGRPGGRAALAAARRQWSRAHLKLFSSRPAGIRSPCRPAGRRGDIWRAIRAREQMKDGQRQSESAAICPAAAGRPAAQTHLSGHLSGHRAAIIRPALAAALAAGDCCCRCVTSLAAKLLN